MKNNLLIVIFFIATTLFSNQAMAQNCSGLHNNHGILCPDTSLNLVGASYNPVNEKWGWYVGVKTVFFHPARYVWMGGIGLGLAFNQSEQGRNVPMLTFVPLKIGSFAVETSINKISATSAVGEQKQTRLAMLSWNWKF